MAPAISKHYPITLGLSRFAPSSLRRKSLLPQLNSSTSLACLDEQPMDTYLKDVRRNLKELFGKFTEIIVHIEVGINVYSPEGKIQLIKWEFDIKQVNNHPTMLEALAMLSQGLFQSNVLLKNVANLDNLQDPEIENLTKLKKHLLELIELVDKVLMFYSSTSMGDKERPHIVDVKRSAKKVRKIINSLSPGRLHNLIPNILVREEDILCSVLGLQGNLAVKLADLPPDVRSHQSDMYFLLRFLEEHGDYSEIDDNLKDVDAVAYKLHEMGFTETRSHNVAKWIAEQPFPEHQSLLAWAQHYVESLFTYDIFLNDYVGKYPYQEEKLNEWFKVPVETDDNRKDGDVESDDDCVIISDVNVINLKTQDSKEMLDKVKELCQQHGVEEEHLYFHGTDHEGAKRILEEGINLGANKRCCDFSDGWGFYLTDSSDFAFDWSKKSEAAAVLVFNVDEKLSKSKCLDLLSSERESDWQKVKNHYRFKTKLPKELRKENKNCDFVKGPISKNSSQQIQHFRQICIRKESIVSTADICGVIFINIP